MQCDMCGESCVRTTFNQKFCPECKNKAYVKRQQEWHKQQYTIDKTVEHKKAKYTLAQMNEAAREHNMTYGQYAAALKEGRVAPPGEKNKRGKRKK